MFVQPLGPFVRHFVRCWGKEGCCTKSKLLLKPGFFLEYCPNELIKFDEIRRSLLEREIMWVQMKGFRS